MGWIKKLQRSHLTPRFAHAWVTLTVVRISSTEKYHLSCFSSAASSVLCRHPAFLQAACKSHFLLLSQPQESWLAFWTCFKLSQFPRTFSRCGIFNTTQFVFGPLSSSVFSFLNKTSFDSRLHHCWCFLVMSSGLIWSSWTRCHQVCLLWFTSGYIRFAYSVFFVCQQI